MPKKVLFRLTALGVKRARGPARIADGRGLYLQVTDTGSKSWLFRYMLAGKAKAHGLGPVEDVTLEQARQETTRCRALLREGVDPILERRARVGAAIASQATSQTFKKVAEACIDANEAGWRNAKHAQQWRNTLATYAYPKLGGIPVGAISTGHVLQCLEPIWKSKPETASRVRGRIEQVLDFAKARELRTGENPARWKGHLDQVLPARASVRAVRHHTALPYAHVPELYRRLVDIEGISAIALRFAILSCGRTSDVIGAVWPEFDLQRDLWVVPAARMKAKREWRVPLAREARALLHHIERDGEYVFARDGKPLSNMAMLELLRRHDVPTTVHGLRSSFADWAAECTNAPHEVREMALAHAVGSRVELAYRRSDMLERRRELAQQWADFVTAKRAKAKAAA
jgi:integrase